MSRGEVGQVSEGIYAYPQPDGGWYLSNPGSLTAAGTSATPAG
jgi:hypothetical protein